MGFLHRWVAMALVAATAAVALVAPAWADPAPEIFPLDQVRRGQKGYGLTTFQGTTPERFEFEVIGVNKNFLPKMDIILVKSEDPKLAVSGFWRGMSGSPLFIDGKVACAFSYGFRFNKLAIGGCTPLGYMTQEGFRRPRRVLDGKDTTIKKSPSARATSRGAGQKHATASHAATINDWLRVAPERTVASAMGLDRSGASRSQKPWFTRSPLPRTAPRQVPESADDQGMTAASVPLAMSGFSAPAFAQAKQIMSPFAVEPMRAGGTGNPDEGPSKFQPGASIGVQILRGDMSAAATGTVSYVDENRVLGFGHPLFQAGELYAPVTAAQVHTVIPSALSAFVIASPLRELGSLVQDRQSTIMADTRLETRMIPLDMYIETDSKSAGKQAGNKVEFHVEVLNNRFMTGPFAGIAAMNAISLYLPDRDHITVAMESTVRVRGYKPLQFIDYLYAEDGAASVIGGARGLRALVVLLNNPYAPVQIEGVELRAKIRYDVNFGTIEDLRLPTAELRPGKRSRVQVHMTTYDGKPFVETVPFDVPESLAGSIVRLEVTAGDSAGLDVAPPKNLDDLMAALRKLLPGNVFAVTLYSAYEGVAVNGKLVCDLPPSAIDRFHPASATHEADLYRPMARSTYPSRRVIDGQKAMLVKIADR